MDSKTLSSPSAKHHIILDDEVDFDGWRKAARKLAANDVQPANVLWSVRGKAPGLLGISEAEEPFETQQTTFNVPAKFIAFAKAAILDRDSGERFALLYRLLWRLRDNHDLLEVATDPDVARVIAMAKAMHCDEHARQTERPRKHWRNLPEASLIRPLIEDAARMTGAMIARAATEPHKPQQRPEPEMKRKAKPADDIEELREEAASCRACPLWKNATQTVFGEGPSHAQIMLVGEQPGDKEDLAGHPFVGPAGGMLDRALAEAGIDREKVYVTNAVKHFKFVPRGKIRLHQKPVTPEIRACRQWYERELAAVKPALVVAMGATAAQCVFGKLTPINKNRGRLIDLDDGLEALVTVHPSYLLRLPDEDAKALEYRRFVDDLKIAARHIRKSARAA